MKTIHTITSKSTRITGARLVSAVAMAVVATACADKGFTPPRSAASTKMVLQITAMGLQQASQQASQQAAFTPKFLLLASGYEVRDSAGNAEIDGLLGYKNFPLTNGTQTLTLSVDLATCLSDPQHTGGKDGCRIAVGAAILADSMSTADADTASFFENAFDVRIVGPFDVVPGRSPTIPAIDLSASRIAAARFTGDEALRLGGPLTPTGFTTRASGVVNSSGAVTIFAGTTGPQNFILNTNQQGQQQGQFFPTLSIFANGVWSRVSATSAPPNSVFKDVSALNPTEVYMAASSGLYKYDGTSIAKVAAVTDSLVAVGTATTATGAKLVIAVGALGATWVGNTTTLTRFVAPGNSPLTGACINSPTEAFAASSDGSLYRFNGTTWTSVPAPFTASKLFLQCTGPGQAFVISNQQALLSWNGTGWQNVPGTGLNGALINLAVVSPTEMYGLADSAASHRGFFRFDGSTWVETARLRFTQGTGINNAPWADPRGGAAYFASSFGRLERWGASGATVLSYQPTLRDAWVNSATSAFVVGWNTFLARWDGSKWNIDAPPPATQVVRVLHGVWSDGPSNAWAVGNSSTIFRWGGTSWSRVSDNQNPITTADNYNAVWGSGTNVWIAGNATMVLCQAGGAGGPGGVSCATESTGGSTPLFSVWGTSPTNVWAVGSGGRIIRRTTQGWSSFPSPTSRALVRVHGSAADNVWAFGDSVLVHFDGTAWTNVPMNDSELDRMKSRAPVSGIANVFELGLFVRAADEVYLGGDFGSMAKFLGFDWEGENVPFRRRIVSIAGSANGCILAVTEGQTDSPVPTLWRGEGGSVCFPSPMAPPTVWP